MNTLQSTHLFAAHGHVECISSTYIHRRPFHVLHVAVYNRQAKFGETRQQSIQGTQSCSCVYVLVVAGGDSKQEGIQREYRVVSIAGMSSSM